VRAGPFRDLPREVPVLVAVAFFVALGFGIVAPAIPVFARDFGVGRAAAGAVISAFAFMRVISALGAGRLVDRTGERIVLATGIGIVAVSSALAGLAQSYAQLVVLRGAGGVGSAMFSVSAGSLILRLVPADHRGRAMGLWTGGFLLGGITGPALGGVITGISIRLPFFIYAGTLAVAGAVGLLALRGTELAGREDAATTQRTSLVQALRNRSYRAALAANLADGWAVLGVRSALVPLFVQDVLHRTPVWTGIGFLLVAAVNGAVLFPAGRYADNFGRKPVLVTGLLLSATGIACLALLPDLGGYLLGLALFGFGSGCLDVAPAAVVGDVVQGRGGSVFAAYQMSADVGAITGPVAAGRLADTSYSAAFGVTAGVLGAAALMAMAAPETRRHVGRVPGAVPVEQPSAGGPA
jgi:MFS family permease